MSRDRLTHLNMAARLQDWACFDHLGGRFKALGLDQDVAGHGIGTSTNVRRSLGADGGESANPMASIDNGRTEAVKPGGPSGFLGCGALGFEPPPENEQVIGHRSSPSGWGS